MDQKPNKPSYDNLKNKYGDINTTGSSRNTSTVDKNIVKKNPFFSFALGSVELLSDHPEMMEKLKKSAFPSVLGNSVYIIPKEENSGFREKRPNFLYHFISMVNAGKTDVYNTLYSFDRSGYVSDESKVDSYHITLTGLQILNALQNSALTRIKNSYVLSEYKEKALNQSEIRQALGKDLIAGQQEGDVGGFDELYAKLQHVKAIESAAHSIYSKLQHYHSVAPPELKPGETNNFNDIASTSKRSEAEVDDMPVNIAVQPNKAVSPEETGNLIDSIVKTLDKIVYTINTGLKRADSEETTLDMDSRERMAPKSDQNYAYIANILKTLKDDLTNKTANASTNRANGARYTVVSLSDFKEKVVAPLNLAKVHLQNAANNIENAYSTAMGQNNIDNVDRVVRNNFTGGDYSGRQKIYVSALAAANLGGDNVKGLANHIDYFITADGMSSFMVPELTENIETGPHYLFNNGTIKYKPHEVIVITPEWIEKTKNNAIPTDDTPSDKPNHVSMRVYKDRDFTTDVNRRAIERMFAKQINDERFNSALEKRNDSDASESTKSAAKKYVNAVMRDFYLRKAMQTFADGFKIDANNPLDIEEGELQEIASGVTAAIQSKNKREGVIFNRRMKNSLVGLRIDPENFSGTFNLFLKDNLSFNKSEDTSETRKKILTNFSQFAFVDWGSEEKNKIYKLEKSDQEALAKLILAVGRFLIDQLGKNESTMIKERVAAKLDLASMVDRLVCYTDTVQTKSGKVYRDLEPLLCRLILTYDPGLGVKSSDGGVCTNKAYKTLRNASDSEETPKRKYFVEVADMVNRFIEVYLVKKNEAYLHLIDRVNDFVAKHGEGVETIKHNTGSSANASNDSKKKSDMNNRVEERGQILRRRHIANMMQELEKSKQAE